MDILLLQHGQQKGCGKGISGSQSIHRIHQLRLLGVILLSVIDQGTLSAPGRHGHTAAPGLQSLTELFDLFLRRVAAGGKGDIHLGPDGLNIILLIPPAGHIVGNRNSRLTELMELSIQMAVAAGMNQLKGQDIIQVLLRQLQRMFINDAALVAHDKFPVAIHQAYLGIAVFPVILAAPGMVHPQLIQSPDHMIRHLIPAKYAHISRICSQHLCIDRKVHGLAAGIHDLCRIIFIAHIIPNADDFRFH